MTSATLATSEGAQGIFSKITFLISVCSNEKDVVCHSFVVKIFTKSLHRGGVLADSMVSARIRFVKAVSKIYALYKMFLFNVKNLKIYQYEVKGLRFQMLLKKNTQFNRPTNNKIQMLLHTI